MSIEVRPGALELSSVTKLSSIARPCTAAEGSMARQAGEYFVAMEPNSFGLPSVSTCPGSTAFCESRCYAIDSERRTATALKLARNMDILASLVTVDEITDKLAELMNGYTQAADKLNIEPPNRRFRIHWSGDFYSVDYATAWANVIKQNQDMRFYTYTRSFTPEVNVLPALSGISNLELFTSVDSDNIHHAAQVLPLFPGVRAAYLVDYAEEAAVLADKLGRDKPAGHRLLSCPENVIKPGGKRKLPVVSSKGGACSVCKYCTDEHKGWDVAFLDKNQLFDPAPKMDFHSMVPVIVRPKNSAPSSSSLENTPNVNQAALF